MRFVCLSDTHSLHERILVPEGDVLIHAGDATEGGSLDEIQVFLKWFGSQPHPTKILVAGNHDYGFESALDIVHLMMPPGVIYLQDSGCQIGSMKVWGSPWQPSFRECAFALPRGGASLRKKWNLIPFDVDVLITHTPPHGVMDVARVEPQGCEELRDRLIHVHPKLHVFGHIHRGYGALKEKGRVSVNASNCNPDGHPVNPPIVREIR